MQKGRRKVIIRAAATTLAAKNTNSTWCPLQLPSKRHNKSKVLLTNMAIANFQGVLDSGLYFSWLRFPSAEAKKGHLEAIVERDT